MQRVPPGPFEIPPATELPSELAIAITVEPVPLEGVRSPSPGEEIRSDREAGVTGREAIRQELVATGAGLFPEGMRSTRWMVDLDRDRTLVARTHDVGDVDYAAKQDVLDEMMEHLVVGDPADEPDPADGLDPVGEPRTDEVATPGFLDSATAIAHLTDARIATHDGFDRVVLEFEGEEEPSWSVTPVDPPIVEDGSGMPIEAAGSAFLELRVTPASAVDLSGPEVVTVYDGPDRVRLDTGVVAEAVRTGDFEANLAWVLGLERNVPFAVAFFEDPLRLVVDVFHEAN